MTGWLTGPGPRERPPVFQVGDYVWAQYSADCWWLGRVVDRDVRQVYGVTRPSHQQSAASRLVAGQPVWDMRHDWLYPATPAELASLELDQEDGL